MTLIDTKVKSKFLKLSVNFEFFQVKMEYSNSLELWLASNLPIEVSRNQCLQS